MSNQQAELTNRHSNGHANGHTNGHANGFTNQAHGGTSGSAHLSPLETLSWDVLKNTVAVNEFLKSKDLPQPSFAADGPSSILPKDAPQSVQEARQKLMAAALELYHLASGPSDFLPNLSVDFNHMSCLSWLCHYKIFHLVPVNGTVSYPDLASTAGVPEQRLKSIMRMAMTTSLFREDPDTAHVRHSSTSAFLAKDEDAYAYACWMCERTAPMAMAMTAAHKRWGPESTDLTQTAYNVAFDTDLPFFQDLKKDKTVTEGFAKYMRAVRSSDSVAMRHLISGFSWHTIQKGGLVVDVGGSSGDAAASLAEAFPHLTLVVEDLQENVETGRRNADTLPLDIASRLTFRAHDFMQPQPIQAADVYLLRMILHDWPDDQAVVILRRLVEAMDHTKSRLVIMDTVLPKPGSVPVSAERITRFRDLTMMQAFNARERELEDWERLIAATDPRLRLVNTRHPCGSAMALLEIELCE